MNATEKEELLQFISASSTSSTKQHRENLSNIKRILAKDRAAETLIKAAHARSKHLPHPLHNLATEYKNRAMHLKVFNSVYGIDLNNPKESSLKDNIDTLIHLATVLSTNTTHPNELILGASRIRQRNTAAQSNFVAAQQELVQTTAQLRDADLLDQKLIQLEHLEVHDGSASKDIHQLNDIHCVIPPTNRLLVETKISQKREKEYEKKCLEERKRLKDTIQMYGQAKGRYSFEDLDALQNDVERMKETLTEKIQYLQAFQDLPPDLELAEFRLAESQGEYDALQQQFEEIRLKMKEERNN
jgi:hypothetical protein|tara:strand:- start:598 stop:1500 length:903 start_codon:yes stop_codon:yes gene_type:complete